MNYKKYIGIIGSSKISEKLYVECEEIGKRLAKFNMPIICGGKNGVMEAVAKGVKSVGGLTIGILPYSKDEANEYIDIPIGTDIGIKRNAIIVENADIIIAISGEYGTLSELAFALQYNKKIICYKNKYAKNIKIPSVNSIDEIMDFVNENI